MAESQPTHPSAGAAGDFAALFEASESNTQSLEIGGEGKIVTGVVV